MLLLAGAGLCIRLGAWQLDRASERAADTTAAEQAALAEAEGGAAGSGAITAKSEKAESADADESKS